MGERGGLWHEIPGGGGKRGTMARGPRRWWKEGDYGTRSQEVCVCVGGGGGGENYGTRSQEVGERGGLEPEIATGG